MANNTATERNQRTSTLTALSHPETSSLLKRLISMAMRSAGAGMPNVLTPLSWSILQPLVSAILFAPCQAVGYVLPEGIEVMRRFSGHAYFDLTTMLWSYCDTVGLQLHEVTRGMGGHQPEIPAPSPHPLCGWVGLRRIAASPGQVSGRARILHHPDEGHTLQTGEVLVASSTDPAWMPLFLRACAVVMETGGYLSHGAIVAREFGIPVFQHNGAEGIVDSRTSTPRSVSTASGNRQAIDGP
jgi:phosphohistidine swiveling domain-containing protein